MSDTKALDGMKDYMLYREALYACGFVIIKQDELAQLRAELDEAEGIIREVGVTVIDGRTMLSPKWLSRCYKWLDGLKANPK